MSFKAIQTKPSRKPVHMIVNEIPIKHIFILGDDAVSHQEVLPVREKTARTREVTRMREARAM